MLGLFLRKLEDLDLLVIFICLMKIQSVALRIRELLRSQNILSKRLTQFYTGCQHGTRAQVEVTSSKIRRLFI